MLLRGKTNTVNSFKLGLLALATVYLLVISMALLPGRQASAAQLTSRKLTLGSSAISTATTWAFSFSAPGTTALNGISFKICTTATGSCTTPGSGASWSNSGATFTSLTYNGSSQGGWTLDNAGAGGAQYLGIKNNSSSTSTANSIVATFSSVTNPDTTNTTFYARITTYTGDDFTSSLDSGVVAASTATQITLSGYMPESLVFCTGGTISTGGGGIPDCSTATSGSLTFPDFSPTATSFITSQMAASTNADSGYAITYSGATLTSGGNTITAMSAATTSSTGFSQFGINLKDNATPNVGADLNPASGGATLQGKPTASYDTTDTFKFTASGDTIANSDFDGTSGPTEAQIYTASYIVNVTGAQPVGTYTTTLTYICTATF